MSLTQGAQKEKVKKPVWENIKIMNHLGEQLGCGTLCYGLVEVLELILKVSST